MLLQILVSDTAGEDGFAIVGVGFEGGKGSCGGSRSSDACQDAAATGGSGGGSASGAGQQGADGGG